MEIGQEDPAFAEFLESWPNCPTPDCGFKVCTWARTGLCYKCSKQVVGEAVLQQRYHETHDSAGFLHDGEFGFTPDQG